MSDSEVHAVDSLLDKRKHKGLVQYLVQWQGGDMTWENRKDLIEDGLLDIIQSFDKMRKQGATPAASKSGSRRGRSTSRAATTGRGRSASKGRGRSSSTTPSKGSKTPAKKATSTRKRAASKSKSPARAASRGRSKTPAKKATSTRKRAASKSKSPARAASKSKTPAKKATSTRKRAASKSKTPAKKATSTRKTRSTRKRAGSGASEAAEYHRGPYPGTVEDRDAAAALEAEKTGRMAVYSSVGGEDKLVVERGTVPGAPPHPRYDEEGELETAKVEGKGVDDDDEEGEDVSGGAAGFGLVELGCFVVGSVGTWVHYTVSQQPPSTEGGTTLQWAGDSHLTLPLPRDTVWVLSALAPFTATAVCMMMAAGQKASNFATYSMLATIWAGICAITAPSGAMAAATLLHPLSAAITAVFVYFALADPAGQARPPRPNLVIGYGLLLVAAGMAFPGMHPEGSNPSQPFYDLFTSPVEASTAFVVRTVAAFAAFAGVGALFRGVSWVLSADNKWSAVHGALAALLLPGSPFRTLVLDALCCACPLKEFGATLASIAFLAVAAM